MNADELKRLFPNCSASTLKRNAEAGSLAQGAVAQCSVCNDALGTPTREAIHASRFYVRVTSYRRRLIDPDNLCPKYFIDCLRYAEIIPNDRAADIVLTVEQHPSQKERTEIDITPL